MYYPRSHERYGDAEPIRDTAVDRERRCFYYPGFTVLVVPMRCLYSLFIAAFVLMAALPAEAQLRSEIPTRPGVAMHDHPGTPVGLATNQWFNRDNFRLAHSYEFSYSQFGGQSLGLGVYTTSLQFQPSNRLAARVDIGVAHSPFGSEAIQSNLGFSHEQPARVFLREATIAYRPTENSVIQFSFQQSPFGGYNPYGYGGHPARYGHGMNPFYGGSSFNAHFGSSSFDSMFWRTNGW